MLHSCSKACLQDTTEFIGQEYSVRSCLFILAFVVCNGKKKDFRKYDSVAVYISVNSFAPIWLQVRKWPLSDPPECEWCKCPA